MYSVNVIKLPNNNYYVKRGETSQLDLSFNFVQNTTFEPDSLPRQYFSRILSRRNGVKSVEGSEFTVKQKQKIRFPTLSSKQNLQRPYVDRGIRIQIQPIQSSQKLVQAKINESFTLDELQEQKRAYCIKQYRKYQQQRLFQQMTLKNQNIKETIQLWIESHSKQG